MIGSEPGDRDGLLAKIRELSPQQARELAARLRPARPRMAFSAFFFAGVAMRPADPFRFLLRAARTVDAHGFCAVWVPERHFHAFGALYPNPAVLAAGLATVTEHVALRAGSVVVPLHHPARLVEEWSVVDNLSHGRVGLSLATGWHPSDFILAPQRFAERRRETYDAIATIRALWSGTPVAFPGPDGTPRPIVTYPRPLRPTLPLWLTSSGNPQTYDDAGRLGTNLLCATIGTSFDTLRERVASYRAARARAGLDPASGTVTVMMHTYLGTSPEQTRAVVAPGLRRYLTSFMEQQRDADIELGDPLQLEAEIAFAIERYLREAALTGTLEHCDEIVGRIAACDVDEIGCLLDFGIDEDEAERGLERLCALAGRYAAPERPA